MGDIKYDLYENPSTGKEEKRYHVRMSKTHLYEFEDLKQHLCHAASVTPGDIDAVIDGICDTLVQELSSGARVSLGQLGYFSLGIQTPTVANPKVVNATRVKVKTINFRPSAQLMKRVTKQSHFVRTANKEHSLPLTDEEMKKRLKLFFQTNESISFREFRMLMDMTKSTAYRRLHRLCKMTFPVLKHIGPHNSSVYVLADDAKWKL